MGRNSLKKAFGLILLSAIFSISGCEKSGLHEMGYLEGTISIGPICPVEKIPPDPACLPTAATYKAYQVSVYTSDGEKRMAQLNPSLDGFFNLGLPAGNYRVALENEQKNPGGSNLPVEISIIPHDKTLLNINIDTGIR
jgi:hypothetical protein